MKDGTGDEERWPGLLAWCEEEGRAVDQDTDLLQHCLLDLMGRGGLGPILAGGIQQLGAVLGDEQLLFVL